MKTVAFETVCSAVAAMCRKANTELSEGMHRSLEQSLARETNPIAKVTLQRILDNARIAADKRLPMCQDTGQVVVFAEVGQEIHFLGGNLREAINAGVRQGYREGHLRASITGDPLRRKNTGDNSPAVVYFDLIEGDRLRLQLMAKGGGCENMSRFKMLTPAHGRDGVIDFVVETARAAGPNACPPMVVGVGIGGSYDFSSVLAKRSLLREPGTPHALPHVAELEQEIFQRLNASGIGPQGYGGDTTALSVQIEVAACHIASLPVSVNIECHAHRCQEVTI